MKNKFKTIIGIVIALFALALCIINIVYAVHYLDVKTNIFTTISGWLSIIATVALGIIAIWQSKYYTLATTKSEYKKDVSNEEEKFLNLCNEFTNFTAYIHPLENLVNSKTNEDNVLKYKWSIDGIYEQMLNNVRNIQLYHYMPNNMKKTVKLMINMTFSLHKDYQDAEKFKNNDIALKNHFEYFFKKVTQWILDFSKVRNDIIQEFRNTIKEIDNCSSIDNLQKLFGEINKKTEKAVNDSNLESKKMEESLEKEKNNG